MTDQPTTPAPLTCTVRDAGKINRPGHRWVEVDNGNLGPTLVEVSETTLCQASILSDPRVTALVARVEREAYQAALDGHCYFGGKIQPDLRSDTRAARMSHLKRHLQAVERSI